MVRPVSLSFDVEGQRTNRLLSPAPAFAFGRGCGGFRRGLNQCLGKTKAARTGKKAPDDGAAKKASEPASASPLSVPITEL